MRSVSAAQSAARPELGRICSYGYNHPRTQIVLARPQTRLLLLLLAATAPAAYAQNNQPITPIQPIKPLAPFHVAPLSQQKPALPIPPAASPAAAPHAKPKPHIKPQQPSFNPDIIVLDPAHGGQDNGTKLGPAGDEKDYTLAFANRLNGLLSAKGFTVVLTHAAATDDASADQRVELANRFHAAACLLLHATASGRGLHLFTSGLTPLSLTNGGAGDFVIAPWDSAQAASLARSLLLVNQMSTSLNELGVPVIVAQSSVSPIDSLTCPAVALEIAPAAAPSTLTDESYQQKVAESLVNALVQWRQFAQQQVAAEQAKASAASGQASGSQPAVTPAPKPKPKPKPVIITAPDEIPLDPGSAKPSPKPAPIVRKPPATAPAPQGVQP